ncbi:IS5 family transposase [Ursidibacter sp. B-7004-1]
MPRTLLDKHWTKLKPILLDLGFYDKSNLKLTLEGILFRLKTGCQSRDIPEYFGKSNTLYRNFRYWVKTGKIDLLFNRLRNEPDWEWLFIDGSHIRVHQHGTGIIGQGIGKTKGGNTTKIHLVVDAVGNPVHIEITEGTIAEVQVAPQCLQSLPLEEVKVISADKGYDAEALREMIKMAGVKSNIPRKRNSRKGNGTMDWYLYKLRHLVENAFARLKHFRGIATRYDKLKAHFRAFVLLACCLVWLPL